MMEGTVSVQTQSNDLTDITAIVIDDHGQRNLQITAYFKQEYGVLKALERFPKTASSSHVA